MFKSFFSKRKISEYTIMIIPDKAGITKNIRINLALVKLVLLLICFVLGCGVILTNTYLKTKQFNLKLMLQNEQQLKNIDTLKTLTEVQESKIKQYEEESEKVNEKLKEITQLEDTVKSIINKEAIIKPSRGGFSPSEEKRTIGDVDEGVYKLEELVNKLSTYSADQRKIPNTLPCIGTITSYFGNRRNPLNTSANEFHPGIDIAGNYGTPIYATADGIIEYSGWLDGYGKAVVIDHGNGYKSVYGHNSSLLVNTGDKITRGDKIAQMGSTGISTGVHCHFEIRENEKPINPLELIKGVL